MTMESNSCPTSLTDRRGQIADTAFRVAREKIEGAHRASDAATRDLRNKLRLAYRVPYHEGESALAEGAGAVTRLMQRYGAFGVAPTSDHGFR